MTPLIGSDGRLVAAPRTVLATSYEGRRVMRDGSRQPITLPAGTEVRQTMMDCGARQMSARVDGVWIGVVAP